MVRSAASVTYISVPGPAEYHRACRTRRMPESGERIRNNRACGPLLPSHQTRISESCRLPTASSGFSAKSLTIRLLENQNSRVRFRQFSIGRGTISSRRGRALAFLHGSPATYCIACCIRAVIVRLAQASSKRFPDPRILDESQHRQLGSATEWPTTNRRKQFRGIKTLRSSSVRRVFVSPVSGLLEGPKPRRVIRKRDTSRSVSRREPSKTCAGTASREEHDRCPGSARIQPPLAGRPPPAAHGTATLCGDGSCQRADSWAQPRDRWPPETAQANELRCTNLFTDSTPQDRQKSTLRCISREFHQC